MDLWESVHIHVSVVKKNMWQTHQGVKVVTVGLTRFWSPRVAARGWFLLFGLLFHKQDKGKKKKKKDWAFLS